MKGDPSAVSDVYGNNAAVLCPKCKRAFVFSGFLHRNTGRICPHCGESRAALSGERITVELTGGIAGDAT